MVRQGTEKAAAVIAVIALVASMLVLGVSTPVGADATDGAPTWAQRLGGTNGVSQTALQEIYRSVATDSAANVIGVGTFLTTATISNTATTLTSAGSVDMMVVKYDSDGSLLWANRYGSVQSDQAFGINTDANDNIYITGFFRGTVAFGSFSLTSTAAAGAASIPDAFIAKLSPSGTVLWASKAGAYQGSGAGAGRRTLVASEVEPDDNGNVYTSGSFNVPVTFATSPATNLPVVGLQDGFVAKFNAGTGAIQWARHVASGAGQTTSVRSLGVVDDGTHDPLLGGTYDAAITFGAGTAGATTLNPVGGLKDGFISRLTAAGVWTWARGVGGSADDEIRGVATDGAAIVWGGKYSGTASFLGTPVTSNGGVDAVAFRVDGAGTNATWVTKVGATLDDEGLEVDIAPNGDVIGGGYYQGALAFGSTTTTEFGQADFLIARMNSAGTPLWASTPAGGPNSDVAFDAKSDPLGGYVFSGYFGGLAPTGSPTPTATFGPVTLVVNGTQEDAVIGRIAPAALQPPENTALPTVGGTAQEGGVLTATSGAWAGDPSSFDYQWRRCDPSGNNCANIPTANTSSYTLVPADTGSTLRVVVTATNGAGSSSATSSPTAVVTGSQAPVNTTSPTISGAAALGVTLTASPGSWSGGPTSFDYQWRRCDSAGDNCTDIADADAPFYDVAPGDLGSRLRVQVVASNAIGTGTAESAATAIVTDPDDCSSASYRCRQIVYPTGLASPTTNPAKVYAPISGLQGPYPLLLVMPGACSTLSTIDWAAPGLVAAGYVVVTLTETGAANNGGTCSDIAQSALQYLVNGGGNPYASDTDVSLIGTTGWSLGGRAQTKLQEVEPLVDAIAVWDNLATSEAGDDGSPACTNIADPIRVPRVPAMGQASDSCEIPPKTAESKKVAYEHWRAAGLPTMQVNFAGSNHFWWGVPGTQAQHDSILYYTIAWFDRWLKQDTTATDRLLADTVLGTPRSTLLSTLYRSAAFIDGADCPDLQAGPCTLPPDEPVNVVSPEITGGAQVGEPLVADDGTWNNEPSGFAHQWFRCDGSGNGCTAIAGATADTYTPIGGDVGATLRVEVTATNAGGAAISRSTATAPVVVRPTLQPGIGIVTEATGSSAVLQIPVTLSSPAAVTVTAGWSTADFTAVAGLDYVAASGSVTFLPGETSATLSVAVLGDSLDENDEAVLVGVSDAEGATVGGSGIGGGFIVDDDAPPKLVPGSVSVVEGNSGTKVALMPVTMDAPSGKVVKFSYQTYNYSASAPGDFATKTGTITIPAGQTSAVVSITVKGDTVREGDEILFVGLANPQNATIGGFFGLGGVVITNDD